MAEDFLEEIYREAEAITNLKTVLDLCWQGNSFIATTKMNSILPQLCGIADKYKALDYVKGSQLQQALMRLNHYKGRIIGLADYIEAELLPHYKEYLQRQNKICVEDEYGYCLESTLSGFLTLRDIEKNHYYHSTVDPMWEAKKIVETFYDPKVRSYSLLGAGLGYIAYQLYCISDGAVKINLFEYSEVLVQYAKHYGVLDWIPAECIQIVVDEDALPFMASIEDEYTGFHIFDAEYYLMPEDIRPYMDELFLNLNTCRWYGLEFERNFYRNTSGNIPFITEFHAEHLKKQFIVVGGGPSVDENLDFLREQKGKRTIIAVGTVFRKLVQAGIRPDMVTILDSSEVVMRQLEGVEDEKIPLFLGTAAYWQLADRYSGKRYLTPVASDIEIETGYSQARGMKLWNCGGTVIIMAVHLAIFSKAEEIYLVGADFAYPGGVSHAEGTADRVKVNLEGMMETEAVNGGMVPTRADLSWFRHNLENLIASTPEVTFINVSPNGAKIAGTKWWYDMEQS